MVYGDFKDLAKRTAAEVLRDTACDIAKDPKYHGYQRGLVSMVCKFFDKKTVGDIKSMPQNERLAEELRKPIIRKIFVKKCIYHSKKIFGVLI